MSDNVIEIGKPPRKHGFKTSELDFRIYELACMATITEAQVTRTLDRRPDDPPELAIFSPCASFAT